MGEIEIDDVRNPVISLLFVGADSDTGMGTSHPSQNRACGATIYDAVIPADILSLYG